MNSTNKNSRYQKYGKGILLVALGVAITIPLSSVFGQVGVGGGVLKNMRSGSDDLLSIGGDAWSNTKFTVTGTTATMNGLRVIVPSNSSAAYALRVANSSPTTLFDVGPTGLVQVNGGTGSALTILGGGDIQINAQVSGSNAVLYNDTGVLNSTVGFRAGGTIETTSGGFKFPDGTTQTTAASVSGASAWSVSGSNISNTNVGNVGIGVASPADKLDISGNLRIGGVVTCIQGTCPPNSAIRLTPNLHLNSGAGYAVIANWDNGTTGSSLAFRVGNGAGADVFDVLANGSTGIGTTSPGYKLHVVGDIYANGGWLRTSGSAGWYSESYGGGFYMSDAAWIRTYGAKNIWTAGGLLGSDGGLTIGYGGTGSPSGGAIIAGNVGIGTANPTAKLEVQGGAGNNYQSTFILGGTTFTHNGSNANSLSISNSYSSIAFNGGDIANYWGIYLTSGPANLTLNRMSGNVGIGTTAPNQKLSITGGIGFANVNDADKKLYSPRDGVLEWMTNNYAAEHSFIVSDQGTAKIILDANGNITFGSTLSTPGRMHTSGGEYLYVLNTNGIMIGKEWGGNGNLYAQGDIGAAGTKNFIIDHPSKPGMQLVHASLEGPEAGVYYRGEASLANGKATVVLPDYFESLVAKGGRTVILTPKFDDENQQISGLAASSVKDGKFSVIATDSKNPTQSFYWEVKAVRGDIKPLVVEKPKVEVKPEPEMKQ